MISVGRAGAAIGQPQPLSMRFDGQGVAVRVQVGQGAAADSADALAARQAQRMWQKVLSTVVGVE
jgi:hypothetical protein